MDGVAIVMGLGLLEYFWFTLETGRARTRFDVQAPATTGHPEFERYLRVQLNTLEQLIIFLPAIFLFASYVSAPWAAASTHPASPPPDYEAPRNSPDSIKGDLSIRVDPWLT